MIVSPNVKPLRPDLKIISDMIEPNSRVLDIGCGDGTLLAYLANQKNVDSRGIELSQEGVNACVALGLSVIQGDADTDLAEYPSDAFDYVVLGQTLQATRNPKDVLETLVRIGRQAIVSFANYGHWRTRLSLLFRGRLPIPAGEHFGWHDNPDIHLCTLLDFLDLCEELGLKIDRGLAVNRHNRIRIIKTGSQTANLNGEQAIFMLSRG
jgi:methionine biosynthesis protein MetW